ncbi:MAG: hypothetical protein ACYC3X_08450 [Pirellulaceae bacterium]
MMTGYASGYASFCTGQEVFFVERKCRGKGIGFVPPWAWTAPPGVRKSNRTLLISVPTAFKARCCDSARNSRRRCGRSSGSGGESSVWKRRWPSCPWRSTVLSIASCSNWPHAWRTTILR